MSSETETPVPDHEAARKWAVILHNHPDRITTPKHANLATAYLALTAERDRLREELADADKAIEQDNNALEMYASKLHAAERRATEAEEKLRESEAALRGVMDLLKGKIRGEEWWAWERINKDAIAHALAPERP